MTATIHLAQFTVALWCVLAAALLPLGCAWLAKSGSGGFDNHDPRAWLARQTGWHARAHAAQA
ncbi:glutathione metabolism protein, partial [Verminephrobacter sp. Larva24]